MANINNDQVFQTLTEDQLVETIASSLRADYGRTTSAVKEIGRHVKAPLRTIRNWYEGNNAPNCRHFVLLARTSPSLVAKFLTMTGYNDILNTAWKTGHEFDQEDAGFRQIYSDNSVTINVTAPRKIASLLNHRQLWFLGRLQQGWLPTASDIELSWCVNIRTARRDISGLVDLGLVRFEGARKTGWYELASI